jgi:hypothetical protein
MKRLKSLVLRHVSTFDSYCTTPSCFTQILVINPAARNACITGDLPTAIQLFTQQIDADPNNFESYANRSFAMARRAAWNGALQDATKVRHTDPSPT